MTCSQFHPKSVTTLLFSSTLPPAPCALRCPLSGAPGPPPLPLWPGLLCGRGVPACQAPLSSPSSPGAVSVGRQERVSLTLVWDLTDAPSLSRAQGLVSPVVACGPHGASFLKPCTLTFKHCAQQPSQARTYSSNTTLLDAKAWKPLGRPGDHTSRDECRIHLSHFRWVPAPFLCLPRPHFSAGTAPYSVQAGLQSPYPPVLSQSLCPSAYSCFAPTPSRIVHPPICLERSGSTRPLSRGACPTSTSVSITVCLFPVPWFRTVPPLSRARCPPPVL